MRGNQGELIRHAVFFDFVSNTSKRKRPATNAAVPMHTDPM
jgi:hypothetical protein